MSTSHPHTGATPAPDAAAGPGAWQARADADEYPYTLKELRNHLDRLGYRARKGQFRGEDVHEMQARVAAFRDSLEHRSRRRAHTRSLGDNDDAAHAARTSYYERRIQAGLADMAARLREESWAGHSPPGLDVASRAWLDQRFAGLRRRLEDALSQAATPRSSGDICAALEDQRRRLVAMEDKLADSVARQNDANRHLISLIDERTREAQDARNAAEPALATLDERLQSLQQGFERAMGELATMKSGTQRLAVRASATVARHTARATAHHVAKAVRDAAPERRFARLEDGVNDCMAETRTLRQETGVIQQTLEEGLEDLRGRINELTLITRKAVAPPAEALAGAPMETAAPEYATGAHVTRQPARRQRPAAPFPPHRPDTSAGRAASPPARAGGGLVSRLGFAVVVALLVAASFAMLYAQLSGTGWRFPVMDSGIPAPASTSSLKEPKLRPASTSEPDGRVIIPGIILTGADPRQV
ncbi:MAG: hypothetical protein ACLFPA_12680 [Dichotomicrobium sp.]